LDMLKKCLSLKQPYADLLVAGKKTIELRTWNTKFRGEFLVHASKKIDKEACKRIKIDPDSLIMGAIIGKAYLYDVKFYDSEKLFIRDRKKHLADIENIDHKYGFMIKDAKKFKKLIIIPGKLRFFKVEIN
jgi:ASCH domain